MNKILTLAITAAVVLTNTFAADMRSAIESPDAKKILKKDYLGPAKKYTMPAGCISNDPDAIARGKFIFHNLNGGAAKGPFPKGLAKKLPDGEPKQYGNCVACHNIEDAQGAGNIGPDLTNYKAYFIDTKTRDNAWVFQKIADPRIDNENTHMTVNLTTGLFTETEICEMTSYIVSEKK